MDFFLLKDRFLKHKEQKGAIPYRVLGLGLGLACLICLVFVLAYSWGKGAGASSPTYSQDPIGFAQDLSSTSQQAQEVEATSRADLTTRSNSIIYVDIKGEVTTPGVYALEAGDRMIDLVDKAGGFTPQADQDQIPLAMILSDQLTVRVPRKGDPATSEAQAPVSQVVEGVATSQADAGKINLNTASLAELESLNGIGPKKAQQILDYRQANGSFQKIEDLLEVTGIGQKTFEGLKDQVTVQ